MPRTAVDTGKPDIRIRAHPYGNLNGVELTACTLDGARWLTTLTAGAVHFFLDNPRTFATWTPANEQALRQSGLLVSDGRPHK